MENLEKNETEEKQRENISSPETPFIDTSKTGTEVKEEAHSVIDINWEEHPEWLEAIERTRQEIIKKYNIPETNVFIEPFANGKQRALRLFILLLHKTDPSQNIYAEGSKAHAYLYSLARSMSSETTLPERKKLAEKIKNSLDMDDFPFILKKGFIDQRNNQFENFPVIKEVLQRKMKEPREKLPNWFIAN
jgi:fido (protein-threonine AMPylation protein)